MSSNYLPTDYQTFIATSRYARWLEEENRRERSRSRDGGRRARCSHCGADFSQSTTMRICEERRHPTTPVAWLDPPRKPHEEHRVEAESCSYVSANLLWRFVGVQHGGSDEGPVAGRSPEVHCPWTDWGVKELCEGIHVLGVSFDYLILKSI